MLWPETKGNNKENIVKEKGGHKLRRDSRPPAAAAAAAIPPPPCWVLDQTQSVRASEKKRKGN